MNDQLSLDLEKLKAQKEGMEKRIKNQDKTSKRHSIDWSGKKWINGVISNYDDIQEEFEKASLYIRETTCHESSLINKELKTELIGIHDEVEFRTYSLLTPWMLDMVLEFKIDLDEIQIKRLREAGATMVSPITNEKTRWVMAGTSLVNNVPKERLLKMGKNWAEKTCMLANNIIFKLHDIMGDNDG